MRKRKPYSLWKRRLNSGNHVWYVRFRLEDGSWSTAKSSGQGTKTAAESWAIEYLRQGQIVTRENVSFGSFAKDFFAWDGQYVRSLTLRGRQIGQRHVANQQAYVDNYLIPAFGPDKLSRIDSDRILELALDLKERGLSASTINHILLTLRTVLQYALRKKYLQSLPDIDTVVGAKVERGILTPEEVQRFFAQDWDDVRHKAINLVAATTGMRLGEIMGLRWQSVHPGWIEVVASWERGVGLKGTKTGRSRNVAVPMKTQTALQEVLTASPWRESDDFVFAGRSRSAPLDHKTVQIKFAGYLAAIGIDEETRRRRGLSFHSWRHFFNSLLINGRIPLLKVQALTGHSSNRMSENYFHPDEYEDVIKLTKDIG